MPKGKQIELIVILKHFYYCDLMKVPEEVLLALHLSYTQKVLACSTLTTRIQFSAWMGQGWMVLSVITQKKKSDPYLEISLKLDTIATLIILLI